MIFTFPLSIFFASSSSSVLNPIIAEFKGFIFKLVFAEIKSLLFMLPILA